MNICIIGGGNIGTYMAAYIASHKRDYITLYTSKVARFEKELELRIEETSEKKIVKIDCITNNLEEAVASAKIIFITLPSFMRKDILNEIAKYIKPNTYVGCIPGFGGSEFCIQPILDKGGIFFGTQRVPVIARLNEYGKSVSLKEKNKYIKVRTIPGKFTNELCGYMGKILDIEAIPLPSYLPITLAPSNPTMHPSRLIEIFYDIQQNVPINHKEEVLFYEKWGDGASNYLLALDEELGSIFKALKINEEGRETILERFQVKNATELTGRIRNTCGFKGILAPMCKYNDNYIPDIESRYFTEDIPYGLCIIKSFAEICQLQTPTTDRILSWGQKLLGKEYIVDGKLVGKDRDELLIPQNIKLLTQNDILDFYTK